jgi:dihydrolipoamide dehydrogenase
MNTFDIAVLGGGPGGYVAAICAAKLGKTVALVEKAELGGTCLNWGCIPTKALLHSADLYQEIKEAASMGIHVEKLAFDYAQIAQRKDRIVKKLRMGIAGLLKGNRVTVFRGEGVLLEAHTLRVGEETIQAGRVILATGSCPAALPIPGIETAKNSDDVLALTALPGSAVIIGGGVIGVEFATMLSSLEVKVTIVEMAAQILPGTEEEIAATMRRILEKKGVTIFTNAKVLAVESGTACLFELDGNERRAQGEMVVVAVGRKPATANIGLEACGIAMERGFVTVDEGMRTSAKDVYAIGDITGKMQLAHVASAQGVVAAHNACGGQRRMRYDIVPACIYTTPEIASVGLTQAQAQARGISVKAGSFPVAANGRSAIMNCAEGVTKIVTDARTGEVLGAQLMAPRATDMVAEIAAVMRAEGTVEELSDTIHPHPTVSEMIMEAAHDVHGQSCHHPISKP